MSAADDIEYYLGNDIEDHMGDTQLGPVLPTVPVNPPPALCSILFLDVDGVLNTRPGSLDADKLDRLGRIQRATWCRIILSSSWRTVPHQLLRFNRALRERGIVLAGMTLDLTSSIGTGSLLQAPARWEEINLWLGNHHGTFDKVVILDDLQDMGPLQRALVRTESDVGLTDPIADKIINLFQQTTP